MLVQLLWASADFFPGEGKISRGGAGRGGLKYTICLKMPKNILFSFKKSRKTYYFGWPMGGTPLRTPMTTIWVSNWFYLFIAEFFATQIIGGAKELVVLL